MPRRKEERQSSVHFDPVEPVVESTPERWKGEQEQRKQKAPEGT